MTINLRKKPRATALIKSYFVSYAPVTRAQRPKGNIKIKSGIGAESGLFWILSLINNNIIELSLK